MSDELAEHLLGALRQQVPGVYTQAVAVAAGVFKARPQFMMKQPEGKRARMVRRALSRVAAAPLAEEVLAAYFLEVRREVLVEWLDTAGVEHEDGALQQETPAAPETAKLDAAVESFLGGENREERELLLQAFAAQSAVDWPDLDAKLEAAAEA